jgi:hypothetical protein
MNSCGCSYYDLQFWIVFLQNNFIFFYFFLKKRLTGLPGDCDGKPAGSPDRFGEEDPYAHVAESEEFQALIIQKMPFFSGMHHQSSFYILNIYIYIYKSFIFIRSVLMGDLWNKD